MFCSLLSNERITMATTNVTLRIDQDTKREADQLFGSLGLNFTTAVNMFLKKAIRERSIPFDVSVEPVRDAKQVELENALNMLLISKEAQSRIASVHEGSPFDAGSILPTDDLSKYL